MWFGIAPAPAPSPRTNTKAWHPPHCTCARHGGATCASPVRAAASLTADSVVSTGAPTPRTARGSPRRPLPLSLSELGAGGKHDVQLTRKAHSPRASDHKLETIRSARSDCTHDTSSARADATLPVPVPIPVPSDTEHRVRRLSRRLSKRHSGQGDSAEHPSGSGDGPHDRPERDQTHHSGPWDNGNNDVATGDWLSTTPSRPRSRIGTGHGFSRPTSGIGSALHSLETFDRPSSPLVPGVPFLAIPAPTRSRRGSRGSSQSRHGERTTQRVHGNLRSPHAVATEACVHLSPPMVERAQPANLVGHTSSVGVVLVDDESFIVSCSIDGSVKVWSRHTLDCLYTLYGHDDAVSCVDLSSRWLVSGSHDTTLRVYESGHGFRFMHTLEGHGGHVTRVTLLKDPLPQQFAISASDDASLRLWDVEHGYCVAVFKSHASRLTCVLVLPSHAGLFCSGSADASVCFWDLATAMISPPRTGNHAPVHYGSLQAFRVHKATVQCLLSGWGGNGTDDLVFSCSNDGTIQWFETRSLQHLGCVDSVQSPVYSMALHPSLGFLVCSTGDGRLLVYSDLAATSGTIAKRELHVSPKWISSLQLLRGRLLACASEDDLYLVNLERPRIERVLATAHGFLNCVRWLKPEKLATSGEDNVVKIWSIY